MLFLTGFPLNTILTAPQTQEAVFVVGIACSAEAIELFIRNLRLAKITSRNQFYYKKLKTAAS